MRVGQSGPAETIWGLVLHIPVGLGVTLSPEAIGCDARDVAAVVHTPLPPKPSGEQRVSATAPDVNMKSRRTAPKEAVIVDFI